MHSEHNAIENYSQVLHAGNLSLDMLTKKVTVGGNVIAFSPQTYTLICTLLQKKGTVVTGEVLYDALYHGASEREQKIVQVLLCRIRKTLRSAGWDGVIDTVWGRGYIIQ